jgi:Na+-transporting methylmalonyl-CoA/oxaloacetate decarboxylase gamma subunit
MKNKLVVLLLILPFFMFAGEEENQIDSISGSNSLKETAFKLQIPLKQLKIYLDLDLKTDSEQALDELHISRSALKKAQKNYSENQSSFYSGIILAGMLIVFLSLIIVGIIIDRMKFLKHLDNYQQQKQERSEKNTIQKMGETISQNDIVAAITAIYLHELETEEESKLLLTWKRATQSPWISAAKFNMPNSMFFQERRK